MSSLLEVSLTKLSEMAVGRGSPLVRLGPPGRCVKVHSCRQRMHVHPPPWCESWPSLTPVTENVASFNPGDL